MSDLGRQADRRARLAAVLARLFAEEPSPELADLVREVDGLRDLATDDPVARDELATTFERLFLREVPPEESIFGSDDGQRGGTVVGELLAMYRQHDFDGGGAWRVTGPDHLGVELAFHAHLCAAEAQAWAADRPERAAQLVEAERSFLGEHLGAWAEVALEAALARLPASSPYATLAGTTIAFLAEEGERLRPAPGHPYVTEGPDTGPPSHLGPARLARWLLAPAHAGGYLDADAIGRAAAVIGVPWRPSDARSHLREVLEEGIAGGDVHRVLLALRPVVAGWTDDHAEREAERPGMAVVWREWRRRAERTLALLDHWSPADVDPLVPARAGVVLLVERFHDCVDFYRDRLGLPVMFTSPGLVCFGFGAGYLMVETGGAAATGPKDPTANPTVLRLNVDDLGAAVRALAARGVDAERADFEWGSIASFTDPDGNRWQLREERGFAADVAGG